MRLGEDLTGAIVRGYKVEDADGIRKGAIVKSGTDKENQCKATTDDNDVFIGVAFTGNALGGVIDVVEAGGLVTVTASGAISGLNKELYMDSSDSQKVTATTPVAAGTYYRIGFSKSITSADGEQVLITVAPAVKVVA